MDKSNKFYSEKLNGKLGIFKLENGKDFIKEACFISTKVYSLLCKNTEIIKCKSIPKKLKLQHQMYKDQLLNYEKPLMAKWNCIRAIKKQQYTMQVSRRCLIPLDLKRYYYDNINSVPFGDESIIGFKALQEVAMECI